jgi:hypothetical protein
MMLAIYRVLGIADGAIWVGCTRLEQAICWSKTRACDGIWRLRERVAVRIAESNEERPS